MYTYDIIKQNLHLLDKFKSRELVPLVCSHCDIIYYKNKNYIQSKINKPLVNNYCSIVCSSLSNVTTVHVTCAYCNASMSKRTKEITNSLNHFCSRSCANTYNNIHKTHGTRRSKLEIWLETQLIQRYPKIEFHFNRKDTINSELDIYIPSIKLAFELNGIFHYEPIYGDTKLQNIQKNDTNKFQKCQEKGISLCIIDTSSQKRFTEKSSQKFLDIITRIVNEHTAGLEPATFTFVE